VFVWGASMKAILLWATIALTIVLSYLGCGYVSVSNPGAYQFSSSELSFSDVSEIFAGKCARCHSGATPPAGFNVETYANIMTRVVAGDPSASTLMSRINDGSMPPDGALSIEMTKKIESWILAGAPESAGGGGGVIPVATPTPAPTPVPTPVPNRAPVIDAGSNQIVTLPTSSTSLAAAAVDPDGTIATILWTQVSGPAASLNNPTILNPMITGLTQGTLVFNLAVTDDAGDTTNDRVQIVVNPVGTPVPTPTPTPVPTATPVPTPTPVPATFTWVSTNILQPKCVSCHGTAGGYSFATYTGTLRAVRPGTSATSLLYTAVLNNSMPKSGTVLTTVQKDAIKRWIDAGALNN
jgi:hypothetical protein